MLPAGHENQRKEVFKKLKSQVLRQWGEFIRSAILEVCLMHKMYSTRYRQCLIQKIASDSADLPISQAFKHLDIFIES